MANQDPNVEVRPMWPWVLLVIVIVLVVLGLIYYFATTATYTNTPVAYDNNAPGVVINNAPGVNGTNVPAYIPTNNAPTNTPATNTTNAPQASAVTVTYNSSGFSPSTVTIAKGQTVIFQDASSTSMRVASDPHPTHNGYPTTGGCVGSTFDSCMNILPGASWSFEFDYVGSWGYHNHLNPNQKGTVVVHP